MAVESSDFDRAAGRTQIPHTRNASHIDGPVNVAARPGRIKSPLPIMAPILMAMTVGRPSPRSRVFNSISVNLIKWKVGG